MYRVIDTSWVDHDKFTNLAHLFAGNKQVSLARVIERVLWAQGVPAAEHSDPSSETDFNARDPGFSGSGWHSHLLRSPRGKRNQFRCKPSVYCPYLRRYIIILHYTPRFITTVDRGSKAVREELTDGYPLCVRVERRASVQRTHFSGETELKA